MSAFMLDCTNTIVSECAQNVTQRSVALSYAFAIKAEIAGIETQEWPRIHDAIRSRWNDKAVERVKRKAWAIIGGNQP
jgi:hypothetical protein